MVEKSIKKQAEELWARYKYEVLSQSPKIYLEIRQYLKSDVVDLSEVHRLIEQARGMEENRQYVYTAMQHMWGYFKKVARPEEKRDFLFRLEQYAAGSVDKGTLIKTLQDLLKHYPNIYLINTSILKEDDE